MCRHDLVTRAARQFDRHPGAGGGDRAADRGLAAADEAGGNAERDGGSRGRQPRRNRRARANDSGTDTR